MQSKFIVEAIAAVDKFISVLDEQIYEYNSNQLNGNYFALFETTIVPFNNQHTSDCSKPNADFSNEKGNN